MTESQVSRAARRARQREQLRGAIRGRPSDDPQLRRMLTSHIHCGEEMQLVSADAALRNEKAGARNGLCLRTYRCMCGFSFDQRPD